MIRRVIEAAALAAALLGTVAGAALAQGVPPSAEGQRPVLTTPEFITGAKQFDEYSAQAGKMAQAQSPNSEVRAYGMKMVKDHSMSAAQLDSAIQVSGMAPVPRVRLNADQQDMLSRLQGLQGKEFDAEYGKQAAISDQHELGLYEEYSRNGDDPAIKQVSMRNVPILKNHVRDAENRVLMMRPPKL